MKALFSPLTLRSITFRNRIFVSPMCQYSSTNGFPTDWHLVHLGSRAVGGAGLVMVEATSVSPEGRISPGDTGIWTDAQAEAFLPVSRFIQEQGAIAGIQLAHAGRKGSCSAPWQGGGPLGIDAGGWQPLAPSAIPFDVGHPVPKAMTAGEMDQVEAQFQGGGLMALGTALGEAQTFTGGKADAQNFDTYQLLRHSRAPKVEVKLFESPEERVGGSGEPPMPTVAPALVNAIYAATKKRVRALPLKNQGFEV